MVETVGIGQSEADIRHLADRVYLVLQPLGGDEVQFLKAGIIEIPDAFILNKCDEGGADTSYHHLKGSLGLARPFDEDPPEIHRTSARTGAGMDELAGAMREVLATRTPRSHAEREPHFLERWVEDEWGRQAAATWSTPSAGPTPCWPTAAGSTPPSWRSTPASARPRRRPLTEPDPPAADGRRLEAEPRGGVVTR